MSKVPFVDLVAWHAPSRAEYQAAFAKILETGAFVGGPQVGEFEAAFASYCGAAHAVSVKTGTDALVLALRALGIGAGDEVIAPANSFFATAEAISLVGATPVLCDVDDATLLVDVDDAARRITPRTKCIVPVHLFGQLADIDRVRALGVRVLEDAAQAHGATRGKHRAGSCGELAGFSFYPTKNLGALGDGGAVVSNNRIIADRVRRLRTYGWSKPQYAELESGRCSRLDEIQAAVLSVKLKSLSRNVERRRRAAARYLAGLSGLPLVLPNEHLGCTHSYHLFVIRSKSRDALEAHLKSSGIGTARHYPWPVHQQPGLASGARIPEPLAVTEQLSTEILSLPMFASMSDAQVDRVVDAVSRFYR